MIASIVGVLMGLAVSVPACIYATKTADAVVDRFDSLALGLVAYTGTFVGVALAVSVPLFGLAVVLLP